MTTREKMRCTSAWRDADGDMHVVLEPERSEGDDKVAAYTRYQMIIKNGEETQQQYARDRIYYLDIVAVVTPVDTGPARIEQYWARERFKGESDAMHEVRTQSGSHAPQEPSLPCICEAQRQLESEVAMAFRSTAEKRVRITKHGVDDGEFFGNGTMRATRVKNGHLLHEVIPDVTEDAGCEAMPSRY